MPNSIELDPGPPLNPYLAVVLSVVTVSFAAVFTRLSAGSSTIFSVNSSSDRSITRFKLLHAAD
jgi:hypothetical protein